MTLPVDSKGAAIENIVEQFYRKSITVWHLPEKEQRQAKKDLKEKAKTAILAILAQEVNKARINELENFQWNDPHFWVNFRLSKLRDETKLLERLG